MSFLDSTGHRNRLVLPGPDADDEDDFDENAFWVVLGGVESIAELFFESMKGQCYKVWHVLELRSNRVTVGGPFVAVLVVLAIKTQGAVEGAKDVRVDTELARIIYSDEISVSGSAFSSTLEIHLE